MKLKTSRKTLPIAVATVLSAGLALSPLALADENPFGSTEIDSGYLLLADSHGDGAEAEGSCGEGKCGEGAEEGADDAADDAADDDAAEDEAAEDEAAEEE